jgi:hypothetical protein
MKLRLFGNSIRLRLTRDEVGELSQGRPIHSSTRFFHGHLDVSILPAAKTSAACLDGKIRVEVRTEDVVRWAYSEDEGIYADDGVSTLAIEKDYACLHKSGAANEGTFPNPSASID